MSDLIYYISHESKTTSMVAWRSEDAARPRCRKTGVGIQGGLQIKKEWEEGSVQDFLGLSDADMALVEIRVLLTKMLRARRTANRITQTKLARDMKTSQSRIAKIENGDPSVSLDLILRALFATGAKPSDVGRQMLAIS